MLQQVVVQLLVGVDPVHSHCGSVGNLKQDSLELYYLRWNGLKDWTAIVMASVSFSGEKNIFFITETVLQKCKSS